MIPIRMTYKPSAYESQIDVDVYHFHMTDEGDAIALIWEPQTQYWMTVPVFALSPITQKQTLVE